MEVLASLHHSLTYENPSESEVVAQLQMLLQSFPLEKLPTRATLAALLAVCGLLTVGEFDPAVARTLRRGDTGEDVLQLQRVLNARGYFSGPFTGLFGSMTQEAVMKLQRSSPGLSVDGIVGPATMAALGGSSGSAPSAAASAGGGGGSGSLRYGSTGPEVRQLQTDLAKAGFYSSSGPFTDYFGELTRSAVISLQTAYNLTPDGVVGARTRAAIAQELQKQGQASPSVDNKDKLLRQGSTGPEVTQLQRDLAKAGVYSSSGPFTGYFGELTKAAVVRLQQRYGAQPDGIVGNTTRELIERALAEAEGISLGGTSAAPQRSTPALAPQKDQIPSDLPELSRPASSQPASDGTTAADLPMSAYPSPIGYIRLKADLTAYDAPDGKPINYAIANGQVIGYLEDKGDGWLKIEVPDKTGSWIFAEPDYSKIEFINAGATPEASPDAETPASSGAIGGWKQDIESLLDRFRIVPQSPAPEASPEAAEPALDFGQRPQPNDYQAWRDLTNSVDQLLARYYGTHKNIDNAS